MLAVLNRTCTDFGRLFGFHVHWTTAARQPIDKVSERLKFAIPIRMKRKFTDIVPDMPGRRTLKVEHRRAIAEKPKNPSKSSDRSEERRVGKECRCRQSADDHTE